MKPIELIAARAAMAMTQPELGRALGYCDRQIRRWERGERNMPLRAQALMRQLMAAQAAQGGK
jgi:DNA-binding transcriptional regulator YiaG